MHSFSEIKRKPQIVHELPRRIRIRSPMFHDPSFDAVYFEAVLENIPGVEHVRFNLGTASVVVEYNGDMACRKTIIQVVGSIPDEAFRPLSFRDELCDPVGTGAKAALALLTPAFPRSLRALSAWGLSIPVLLEGLETLLNRGVKVKVLDASVVSFSLMRRIILRRMLYLPFLPWENISKNFPKTGRRDC